MNTLLYAFLLTSLIAFGCPYRQYDRVQLIESSFKVYTANLLFGSPAKLQSLVFDTGSSLTILPCAECQTCLSDRAEPFYNKDQSFTGSKVKCSSRYSICSDKCSGRKQYCEFEMSYLDGSQTLGTIISDQIRLNMPESGEDDFFVAQFGCISLQNHQIQFFNKGIVGISQVPSQNMFYKWYEQDPQRKLQFSFCLMKGKGYFQLGHNPSNDLLEPSNVLRLKRQNRGSYKLRDLEDMKIGVLSLANKTILSNFGMVVDTGSSRTVLPPAEYQKLSIYLSKRCESNPRICSVLPTSNLECCYSIRLHSKQNFEEDLSTVFPTIDFVFKDQILTWNPSQYFQIMDLTSDGRAICLMVIAFDQDVYILGVNWMINKKMAINMQEETLTIYADQNCTYVPIKRGDVGWWEDLVEKVNGIDTEYLLFAGVVLFLVILILRENIHRGLMKLRGVIVRVFGLKKKKNKLREETKQIQQPSSDSNKKDNVELMTANPDLINIQQSQHPSNSQEPHPQ